jgi:hypothetical protein
MSRFAHLLRELYYKKWPPPLFVTWEETLEATAEGPPLRLSLFVATSGHHRTELTRHQRRWGPFPLPRRGAAVWQGEVSAMAA